MFMQIKYNIHSVIYSEEYQRYPSCKQSLALFASPLIFAFLFTEIYKKIRPSGAAKIRPRQPDSTET